MRRMQMQLRLYPDPELLKAAAPVTVFDAELAARFAAADTRVTERDTAAQEEDRRTRKDALDSLLQLAARVEPLAARGDLALKPAERALRDPHELGGHDHVGLRRADDAELVDDHACPFSVASRPASAKNRRWRYSPSWLVPAGPFGRSCR